MIEEMREGRLAVEGRAEETGLACMCVRVCVCVAFIYHGNKRFIVRHEKQIAHCRSVIYASLLGLGCICTCKHIYTGTRWHAEVLIHTHILYAHTNRVYSSPVSRCGPV